MNSIPAKLVCSPYQREFLTLELPHMFQTGYNPFENDGKPIIQSFIDEDGKITNIRYKVMKIIKGDVHEFGKPITNFIYRLDRRSIRYMKRVVVKEN